MRQLYSVTQFSQLLKSLKLYFVFMRYAAVGFTSFVIDVSVFALVLWSTHHKFYSLFIGRVVSGSFNFYFNKYLVYRSLNKSVTKREACYYLCLAVVIFALSYTAITEVTTYFHIHVVVVKIVVDIVLFFTNFLIQTHLFKYGAMTALKQTQEQGYARKTY